MSLLATRRRARSEEGCEKGCSRRLACSSATVRQQKDCKTRTVLRSVKPHRSSSCLRFAVHAVIIDCK
eukprot:2306413-Rhodomonas_salina.1